MSPPFEYLGLDKCGSVISETTNSRLVWIHYKLLLDFAHSNGRAIADHAVFVLCARHGAWRASANQSAVVAGWCDLGVEVPYGP